MFYKANEVEYDELAERLGKLITRKEKRKKETHLHNQQGNLVDEQNPVPIENYEEEPIYDLPPELEARVKAHIHHDV